MTAFASKTFDAASYLRCRPTYPTSLLQDVVRYAQPLPSGKQARAIDIGCGAGQSTDALSQTNAISEILGIDPSKNMIDTASSWLRKDHLKFRVGDAERLQDFIEESSLDIVISAQAAHWFNHTVTYPQFTRALKPGGTLAFISYGIAYLPDHTQLSALLHTFMTQTLGPYWEKGREYVDQQYDQLPVPDFKDPGCSWTDFQRHKYHPNVQDYPGGPVIAKELRHQAVIEKVWTAQDLQDYLKTASAVHTYSKQHPETDVTGDFIRSLVAQGLPQTEKFKTQYPLTLIMMKRK